MKLRPAHLLYSLLLLSVVSCSSGDNSEIDEEKPTISINYTGGFPQACAILQRGQTYTFKAQVTDNVALAAYSLEIHHNFDHHTHDDQGAQCELDDIKGAVDPLIYMKNFSIDNGITSYEISIPLTIPEDVDTGDYHCSFSVIDKTGWQSITSVDIKIVE
tara:strand:+ start:7591 stop:8070 length:480 start_codon:yes stop_codon:yes gene_type:complete